MRISLHDSIVIIDEAHNIEDASREAVSLSSPFAELEGLNRELAAATLIAVAASKPDADDNPARILPYSIADSLSSLSSFVSNMFEWCQHMCSTLTPSKYGEAQQVLQGAELAAAFATYWDERMRKCAARIPPPQPARGVKSGAASPEAPTVASSAAKSSSLLKSPLTVENLNNMQMLLAKYARDWYMFRTDVLRPSEKQQQEEDKRAESLNAQKRRKVSESAAATAGRSAELLSHRMAMVLSSLLRTLSLALNSRTARDYRVVFTRVQRKPGAGNDGSGELFVTRGKLTPSSSLATSMRRVKLAWAALNRGAADAAPQAAQLLEMKAPTSAWDDEVRAAAQLQQ